MIIHPAIIREYFSDSISILGNRKFDLTKRLYLFFHYSRASFQNFLDHRFKVYTEVSFLSFSIKIESHKEFFMLVKELFIGEPYYFESSRMDPVIIDVGSNVGMSIIYFKYLYPKCKIIGFEPDPYIFRQLKENINRNNFSGVTVYNLAIGENPGKSYFYKNTSTSLFSTLIQEAAGHSERIEVLTDLLSKYVKEKVDLLKIDIQFSEQVAIEDLFLRNKLGYIKKIIMEFHCLLGYEGNLLSKIIGIFEKENFFYIIRLDRIISNKFATYFIEAEKR